ncbi:hypothetical protein PIB30_037717 [Stylosanthes scabra]|uniref:Glycosyltransferase n=1 Tax=Stylosanthes scabra TaxID=79078 RepID=A0ABU6ZBY0_9FABA|nr:hypothetical protein [Stylosanthes scabra]
MESKTIHIALVSAPVYSHLRSILEFAKQLVQLHQDLYVTCLVPIDGSPCNKTKALLQSLPPTIDYIFVLPKNLEDSTQDTHPAFLVRTLMIRSLPLIRDELKKLISKSRLAAIISDGIITQVLELAKDLKVLSYTYFPSSAMLLALCLYSENLDKTTSSEFKDLLEPIKIPGCIPIGGVDLPDPFEDRSSETYKEFLEGSKRFFLADGILINTFFEMEAGTIKELQEQESRGMIPSVHAIGPFVQNESNCAIMEGNKYNGMECLNWLNKQQKGSVLYLSFGSGGTITHEQIIELALGLELSGQKFLWLLKPPSKFGIIFEFGDFSKDPLKYLPNGFLERTKKQGFIVPYWAPQIKILGHSAIGGYLCHCGWNSVLESVVQGIPMIAWPLFAEQKMNAVLFCNSLEVAVRAKVNEMGIVERGEVALVIKLMIEGERSQGGITSWLGAGSSYEAEMSSGAFGSSIMPGKEVK